MKETSLIHVLTVNQENTNLKIIIKGHGAQIGQRVRLASMDLHHQVLPTEYAPLANQEDTKVKTVILLRPVQLIWHPVLLEDINQQLHPQQSTERVQIVPQVATKHP